MPAHKQPSRFQLALRGTYLLLRGLLATAVLTVLVVGIPWGLIRYIGWPLPPRLPAWSEIEAVLLTPMSTGFLLNALACILWPVWVAFVYDVVRATADEAWGFARPARPRTGPLNAAAAVLVGTVIMALLAQRSAAPATSVPISAATSPVTTVNTPTLLPAGVVAVPQPATVQPHQHSRTGETVEVEPPRDGIYDSLWRIAARTLGDGSRWPEIYALNCGLPQFDGRSLTMPDLIRPGWIFRLPDDSSNPAPHAPGPREPTSPWPESPRPPQTSAPTTPSPPLDTVPPTNTPATPSTPTAPPPHHPGVSLPTGAFVGIGLATLITAALLAVRWRRRVNYLPGSGQRDDLTIAPVVRALRVAHDDATRVDEPDVPDDSDQAVQPRPALHEAPRPPGEAPAPGASASVGARLIGVKDGQALAWNIARARGLGLIGPGALDAIRALLVALLAEPQHPTAGDVEILIPASDAHTLIGEDTGHPARLRVVDDLDAALDAMEAELLTRTRTDPEAGSAGTRPFAGDLVLVATPAPHADRRLQAVLDNGSTLGLAGILFGQWRPGGTVRVRLDGTVAATSSSVADVLADARLFTLPTVDTQALLDFLRDAEAPSPLRVQRSPNTAGTSAPALDKGDVDSAAPAPRPTSARSRRRLAHGPARGSQPQQPSHASDRQHPADRDDMETGEVSPTTGDDDAQRPLHLAVLGRTRLTHHRTGGDEHADLGNSLAPKQREVLAYLALHRNGVRREALTTAIWPDAPRDRPYNSFHATLSQLRRALRTATHDALSDVTMHEDGLYGLNRDQTTVDLWHLQDALETSRDVTGAQHRRTALERVLELYVGDLAADLTVEWIEAHREALRRDVLDAVSALVRILRDDEPGQALALLERARTLDRYNEAIYRDIARFQAQLGQHDAISRTLALLTRTLAEIEEEPSRETKTLCDFLQLPRSAKRTTGGREAG
ncbi:hypothetical protein [Streptomyces sp. NPDC046909]|uniref:hypothetical protein n=1 Tax=Streptomyces sp. NPDC046909 TaxID=3155617 RepID=UPI0033E309AD